MHRLGMTRSIWLLSALAVLWVAGCSRHDVPASKPSELRLLCGSSMATPGQEVVRLFKEQQSVAAFLDLGGSETLLPRILANAAADIFICHDPFEQKVKEAGLWTGSARVGGLRPVLLVRPGNPYHLHSVNDLTNQSLKIGIGDPRYSTCGAVFVELLEQRGLRDAVLKQVVLQARSHAEIANGLILGSLDAVVVWNYIALLYQGKTELVSTADPYPAINITVVGLKQSANPRARDAFLDFCRGETVKQIFLQQGYDATLTK